jgi:hypothetical protein
MSEWTDEAQLGTQGVLLRWPSVRLRTAPADSERNPFSDLLADLKKSDVAVNWEHFACRLERNNRCHPPRPMIRQCPVKHVSHRGTSF